MMWILPLVVGLVVCVLSIPLVAQKIPPNLLYGLRTPKTMSDKGLWYKANRRAGLWLFAAGLIAVIGAGGLWIFQGNLSSMTIQVVGLILTLTPLVTVIVINVLSYRIGHWVRWLKA
ncbi:SdpI family protein [Candidatus Acetothermia bacterium]|nr:SdpI family protein [Candidatus Acetothermia bacterium]